MRRTGGENLYCMAMLTAEGIWQKRGWLGEEEEQIGEDRFNSSELMCSDYMSSSFSLSFSLSFSYTEPALDAASRSHTPLLGPNPLWAG